MSGVGLIIDNPNRDLDGLLLVAVHLAEKGIPVFLIPMYEQGYDLVRIRPNVVVLNYARNQNRQLISGYRSIGMKICILDTEGGVLSESGGDSPEIWARNFRKNGWPELIDHYFFWGKALHGAFVSISGMSQDRLHLTGCPRYDLCVPPWCETLGEEESAYILVNTNFSAINPRFTRSMEVEKKVFVESGWEPDYVSRLFRELNEVFPKYLDTVLKMAQRSPDRVVLVRPHPFEDEAVYRKYFNGIGNIRISREGSIFDVIRKAECVVHLNCSTAIEANLLNRDPISLEFLNTEFLKQHSPLPSLLSLPVDSVDELCKLASDKDMRERRDPIRKERLQHLEPWYYLPDGRAAERVANTLISLISKHRDSIRVSINDMLRGGRTKATFSQRLQGFACLFAGSYGVSCMRTWFSPYRKDKSLSIDAVKARVTEIARVGGIRAPEIRRARTAAGLPLATLEILPAFRG